MNILLLLCILAASTVIIVDLTGWYFLSEKKEGTGTEPKECPAVAILIPARNEAEKLSRCLEAVERIDYPTDRLRVLIGNDHSTDATPELALSFCKRNKGWEVVNIKDSGGLLKGKANVLAQLSKLARSSADYYFMTDADVAVSEGWVKQMLSFFSQERVLLSGTTLVEGDSCFARWQRMDWLKGQALVAAFSYLPGLGKTVTVTGTNMAVQREAYERVGGFEKIPFSVTEDFELNRQIHKRGYSSLYISTPATKAFTLPIPDWPGLLQQRKRWMKGAMQLPIPIRMVLFIQALFFPVILVILLYSPILGALFLGLKWSAQGLLVRRMLARLKESIVLPSVGYELYCFILNFSLLIFYFLPIPIKWKGRRYSSFNW